MSTDLPGISDAHRLNGAYTEADPDTIHRARLFVTGHARDTDDARVLLDALGIGATT